MFRQLLVSGLAALCIVMTIVPFHKDETWWVRACDFPRSQIAVLIVATLAALAAFLEMSGFNLALAFVLLLCLGAQLAVILPYTPCGRPSTQSRDARRAAQLSLLIVNVLMENRAFDRLAEIISSNDPISSLRSRPTTGGAGASRRLSPDIGFRSRTRCPTPTA